MTKLPDANNTHNTTFLFPAAGAAPGLANAYISDLLQNTSDLLKKNVGLGSFQVRHCLTYGAMALVGSEDYTPTQPSSYLRSGGLIELAAEGLPQIASRERSKETDGFVAHGVLKSDMPSVQRDTAVRITAPGPVLEIALDRTAHVGQLTAYLVMAARQETHAQEEVAAGSGQEPIAQPRQLGLAALTGDHIRLVLLLIAHEPVFQFTLVLLRTPLHDGEIRLGDLSQSKELIHARESLARACKDDQPAHRPVQAMRHTEVDLPRLGILLLDIGLDLVTERLVARLVALHNLTSRLGDDDDMIILVEYLHMYGQKVKKRPCPRALQHLGQSLS